MANNIKIIQSETEPNTKDIWFDKGELKVFDGSQWSKVSGSSEGLPEDFLEEYKLQRQQDTDKALVWNYIQNHDLEDDDWVVVDHGEDNTETKIKVFKNLGTNISHSYFNVPVVPKAATSVSFSTGAWNKWCKVLDCSSWDTSNITNMGNLFWMCNRSSFEDIYNWDTSNVTTLRNAFGRNYYCDKLDLSKWDVSNVTSTYQMFYDTNFKDIKMADLDWNSLTSASQMFYIAAGLEALTIPNWNAPVLTTIDNFLATSENVEKIDMSSFDAPKVTNAKFAFAQCKKLKSLDLSTWNLLKITNIYGMFHSCESLEDLDLSGIGGNVTDMSYAFNICEKLKYLDLHNFNTSNTTSMLQLFCYDENLETINMSGWDFSKVQNMNYMFYDCHSLKNIIGPVTGIKKEFDVWDSPLTRESALVIINGLEQVTAKTMLWISPETEAQLTAEDIAIATSKGWTVASE